VEAQPGGKRGGGGFKHALTEMPRHENLTAGVSGWQKNRWTLKANTGIQSSPGKAKTDDAPQALIGGAGGAGMRGDEVGDCDVPHSEEKIGGVQEMPVINVGHGDRTTKKL